MRVFKFRKEDGPVRGGAFYCRHHNRLVGDCPLQGGSCDCPVRRDCPAHEAASAEASQARESGRP